MPVYTIRNNETLEEFEVNMKFTELEDYLAKNSHLQQIFRKFPGVADSVRIGVRKTDSSFKDVLSKAKNAHWKSTIEY